MQIPTLPIHLGAGEIARSIAAGDLSAREVVDAHIARIEEVDDRLNAVVMPRFDEARREADATDAARRGGDHLGPLAGVPVTIKDQFDVAGRPTTFGTPRLADHVPAADGAMVAALREAGAIVVGKTNVPQGLGAVETDNPLFGRTNNPWDLARTPGGSSGGDAAIVAAGGVPLGLGADYGGSLRVPAAWCGVATIKSTSRRLPCDAAPIRNATGTEGIVAQPGPLARSTADVGLVLRVMADAVVRRPSGANPPLPLRDPGDVDLATTRVALLGEVDGFAPSPAVRRALEEAAEALRDRGAAVEAWDPHPDTARGIELAMRLYTADGAGFSREMIGTDRPHPLVKTDVQVMALPNPLIGAVAAALRASGQTRAGGLLRHVRKLSADELMQVLGDRSAYETAFLSGLDAGGYDAVLCPATPLPAPAHGQTPDIPDAPLPAMLFNMLGMPAGVVPVTRVRPEEETARGESRDKALAAARRAEQGSAGLPVGVQIAARHWREDVVLAAMAAVEAGAVTRGGYPERPPI